MTFRLPSFILTVRDLTEDELSANRGGIAEGRDYFAVVIRRKGERTGITLCVGSPIIMLEGSVWNEASAARSAISFANAPWCADNDTEREWMEAYGEKLTIEAYCHRTLGKEMRECA